MKYVPEMWRGKKEDFEVEYYMDVNYSLKLHLFNFCDPIPVDKNLVDEGVCIRREGLKPYVTKAKSPMFYEYETKLLDEGIEGVG